MDKPKQDRRSVAVTRTKIVQCRVCGKDMKVGSNTRKAQRCLECGIAAALANAQSLHNKSGAGYERWRDAMSRFVKREGITSTPPSQMANDSDTV